MIPPSQGSHPCVVVVNDTSFLNADLSPLIPPTPQQGESNLVFKRSFLPQSPMATMQGLEKSGGRKNPSLTGLKENDDDKSNEEEKCFAITRSFSQRSSWCVMRSTNKVNPLTQQPGTRKVRKRRFSEGAPTFQKEGNLTTVRNYWDNREDDLNMSGDEECEGENGRKEENRGPNDMSTEDEKVGGGALQKARKKTVSRPQRPCHYRVSYEGVEALRVSCAFSSGRGKKETPSWNRPLEQQWYIECGGRGLEDICEGTSTWKKPHQKEAVNEGKRRVSLKVVNKLITEKPSANLARLNSLVEVIRQCGGDDMGAVRKSSMSFFSSLEGRKTSVLLEAKKRSLKLQFDISSRRNSLTCPRSSSGKFKGRKCNSTVSRRSKNDKNIYESHREDRERTRVPRCDTSQVNLFPPVENNGAGPVGEFRKDGKRCRTLPMIGVTATHHHHQHHQHQQQQQQQQQQICDDGRKSGWLSHPRCTPRTTGRESSMEKRNITTTTTIQSFNMEDDVNLKTFIPSPNGTRHVASPQQQNDASPNRAIVGEAKARASDNWAIRNTTLTFPPQFFSPDAASLPNDDSSTTIKRRPVGKSRLTTKTTFPPLCTPRIFGKEEPKKVTIMNLKPTDQARESKLVYPSQGHARAVSVYTPRRPLIRKTTQCLSNHRSPSKGEQPPGTQPYARSSSTVPELSGCHIIIKSYF